MLEVFKFLELFCAALYLMGVSVMAGFWGQFFIRKLIAILKRASLIVFILSAVIFASAITMGNFESYGQTYINIWSLKWKTAGNFYVESYFPLGWWS